VDVQSARAFHQLVTALDYPLYIVTVASGGDRDGCVVGFASQCSITPGRWWVGMSKPNHTTRLAAQAEHLVVHVPGPGERDLLDLFATTTGDRVDKFAGLAWHAAPDGVTPVVDRCRRWFLARILERLDTGDHFTYVVEPVAAAAGGPPGQISYQQAKDLHAAHEA
jgi:flavin reductase (DIM6/NTAB) family NADH-FMN oxidoreductase RutF